METESEESDEEGGMGNVNRVVLRPPGHSGKAKKGHLLFDASFETGPLLSNLEKKIKSLQIFKNLSNS